MRVVGKVPAAKIATDNSGVYESRGTWEQIKCSAANVELTAAQRVGIISVR